MSFAIETEYEWRVFPFDTKESLEKDYPNEADRRRYLASAGYIGVNKDSLKIGVNFQVRNLSIEETGIFISGLRHAVGIAKDL